jgi:hypothetical protein
MRTVPGIDIAGTSFHDSVIFATPGELTRVLGDPTEADNTGAGDPNFEWAGETEAGDPVTLYDWKVYHPLGPDEEACFHIGGRSRAATERAKRELLRELPGHDHARTERCRVEERICLITQLRQRLWSDSDAHE